MTGASYRQAAPCAAVFLHAATAAAQLRATPVVSGLARSPSASEDPADLVTRYAVEPRGTIRVVRNEVLQPAPFLDLIASIASVTNAACSGWRSRRTTAPAHASTSTSRIPPATRSSRGSNDRPQRRCSPIRRRDSICAGRPASA
jgi:hypothetical protein